MFSTSNGDTHDRWRALDHDGAVRELLLQSRRDTAAAKAFCRTRLTGRQDVPRVVSTASTSA